VKLVLDLTIAAASGRQYGGFLSSHLHRAHAMYRSSLAELSVALVGDREMSRVHRRFMNISGPTDVLTFPLETDSRGRCTSGEIILCLPEARRSAKRQGVRVEHELLLYALHGMLHLHGLDDRTESGYRQMHRMEDLILKKLGIGPVFHAHGRRGG
jgi:probable rRNA maturation factor